MPELIIRNLNEQMVDELSTKSCKSIKSTHRIRNQFDRTAMKLVTRTLVRGSDKQCGRQ